MVVWIEIIPHTPSLHIILVTTCVVVWIEIQLNYIIPGASWVTTCVVVWIEMDMGLRSIRQLIVTTCVVVWIEMQGTQPPAFGLKSPPAWWCGLKFIGHTNQRNQHRHHLRGGVD